MWSDNIFSRSVDNSSKLEVPTLVMQLMNHFWPRRFDLKSRVFLYRSNLVENWLQLITSDCLDTRRVDKVDCSFFAFRCLGLFGALAQSLSSPDRITKTVN